MKPESGAIPGGDAFERLLAERPGADWLGTVVSADESRGDRRTLFVECSPAEPVQRSTEKLRTHLAERVPTACDNPGQRHRLRELLGDTDAALGIGLLSGG